MANQEANVKFNIQTYDKVSFDFGDKAPFVVTYSDETLKDLLLIVNSARQAERAYKHVMDRISNPDDKEDISEDEIAKMFSLYKDGIDKFLHKAFGDADTKRLYDLCKGIFLGRVTTAFDVISDALIAVSNGATPEQLQSTVKREAGKRIQTSNRAARRANKRNTKNGKVTPFVQPNTEE